jgi:lysozyme
MVTSDIGIDAIEQREGKRNKAYKDSRGFWTIGVGHYGPNVHEGLAWTDQQIADALKDDLKTAEDAINLYVKVPLRQNQFDALVSFVFNIGVHAFETSTVLRRLNQGDYMGGALAMLMWEKQKELVNRRESEYNQFIA